MIDWVTASLPYDWGHRPILGGRHLKLDPDGTVTKEVLLSEHVRGSHDEHLTLRTVERGRIEFDGNPSKFVQGHNICGSDDLNGLVAAAMVKALGIIGRACPPEAVAAWHAGDYYPRRVDVTQMFELRNRADVRAWIRAAGDQARMKWRKPQKDRGTLYFGRVAKGERASGWSIKAYCKADEIEAKGKGHRLHDLLPMRDELAAWADNKLRIETLLRGQELRRYGGGRMAHASAWNDESARAIFANYYSKMELGENVMLKAEVEESLKPAMRLAYQAWRDGHDLLGVLPQATFYRYRAKILELTEGGIDIAIPQAKSNVVALKRVLTLEPAAHPAFLADRPDLLFRRAA